MRLSQFDFKTGRTWPNLVPSERTKKHEGIRFESLLADLCGRQTRPRKCHTHKIRVLLRYGSDGQN